MAEKKPPTVHFSNKLEQLAESLGEELWKKGGDPFAKRLVILPHHGLKNFLTSFFARDPKWGISAGVEYKILIEGVKSLLDGEEKFPSELSFFFALENQIRILLEEENPSSLFLEMKRYIGPLKNEDKIRWIASELARLFYQYGMFEPKALLFWLSQRGWEQELWKKVFAAFPSWRSLSEVLPFKEGGNRAIHLFGFSHLPSHIHHFFCKFSVKFFLLSPSEMFWEDLCSDKERIYLEKRMEKGKVRLQIQEQLRFFLTKTHPLLSNWGRLGRPLLAELGERECYLEEKYSKEVSKGVLGVIQNSLLELEDNDEKKEIFQEDASLFFVSASSKFREVEILSQTLQELMQKKPIEPKDVLVLVSDLKAYLPYIHAVFGSLTSPFSYSVHGLFSQKDPKKGITSFLPMIEERFSFESVFTFLAIPSVMSKWDFTHKDLSLLRKWFEKVHTLWGLCPKYKKKSLEKTAPEGFLSQEPSEGGTWQEGIQKLLYTLSKEEKHSSFSIKWTETELLGRFIQLMEKIKEELRPIYEEEKRSFLDWIAFLRRWEDLCLPNQSEEAFFQDLESFMEECQEISQSPLSFKSFERAIKTHFENKKESFPNSRLQAVKFLSLEMGSVFPSEILYVLGCDEESFPKKEKRICFEKKGTQKETPPFLDQSRYIFLELLLHARSSLVLSYPRISSQDQKIQGPCRMVQELFSYLDTRFFISDTKKKPSEFLKKEHPSLSFAKEYFKKKSPFVSFSRQAFSLAKSYYLKNKEPFPLFFPSWRNKEIKKESLLSSPITIEIGKLQDFAKNPLRFYFKEKLGLFFDFSAKEDPEFFLSSLRKKNILKRSLKHSLQEVLKEAKESGELPLGSFGKIAEKDLWEEAKKWKEALEGFGLEEKDLFSLEFVDGVRLAEKKLDRFILPPPLLEVEGIGSVSLQGDLSSVSSKGLVWFGKKKKEEYPVLYPSYLIFLYLAKEFSFEKECLFIQEGKKISFSSEDPGKALAKYLNLYLRCLEEPCPIRPDFLLALLQDDEQELTKKMASSSYDTGFLDPYDQWIEKRDPPPFAWHIQKEWKRDFDAVYSSFLKKVES